MKNVLYADDNSNDRLLFESACRIGRVSFRLRTLSDGGEALRYLGGEGSFANRAEHPLPDLILLDLKMPEMDGFCVLRWIRATRLTQTIPVAVYSASPISEDVTLAYSEGANYFIVKPAHFSALVDIVQAADQYLGADPPKAEALARFSASPAQPKGPVSAQQGIDRGFVSS